MFQPSQELYPFKSSWLDIAGVRIPTVRMHYLDEGPADAPIVLMVHGNPTWSFYYRNLVLALRDRYRCIVPDHIGCGLSDKPADNLYPYTLARRISDLTALMDHVQTQSKARRPIHLVVHDWGGMIGFGWAANQPENIASMVVANTAAFPLPKDKKMPGALSFVRNTAIGAWLVRGLNAFSFLATRVAFKKPVSAEVRRQFTGPYNSWANRIATLRFVQDIPLSPEDSAWNIVASTEARLPDFASKPCLLVWGEKDFVFDLSFLRKWKGIFPQARVLSYPDCGHYILEDGGPELTSSIAAFLDGNLDEHGSPAS